MMSCCQWPFVKYSAGYERHHTNTHTNSPATFTQLVVLIALIFIRTHTQPLSVQFSVLFFFFFSFLCQYHKHFENELFAGGCLLYYIYEKERKKTCLAHHRLLRHCFFNHAICGYPTLLQVFRIQLLMEFQMKECLQLGL